LSQPIDNKYKNFSYIIGQVEDGSPAVLGVGTGAACYHGRIKMRSAVFMKACIMGRNKKYEDHEMRQEKLKILLLQARHIDDLARHEERQSFAARAGLDLQQIVPFDLLEKAPTLAEIRRFDALMVGGSGAYSVSKNDLPNQNAVMATMAEVVDAGHPTFASCYGFHLLVQAMGGKIIHDPGCTEVGAFELTLSTHGRGDELFGYLPDTFMAQLGHKDRASCLPRGVFNLASSARAPYQALRVPGKPIWATQFHPELTVEDNLLRFSRYKHVYANLYSPLELQALVDGFRPSLEVEELIPRFLELVFG
jgi:GMP synthase (glutamine-hydrolysing)